MASTIAVLKNAPADVRSLIHISTQNCLTQMRAGHNVELQRSAFVPAEG